MDYLEDLFAMLWDESDPKTPEFLESKKRQSSVSDKMQELVGPDLIDEYMNVYWEYMELECRRYFLDGLRLGLEQIKLL